jgi:tight adherence protein B
MLGYAILAFLIVFAIVVLLMLVLGGSGGESKSEQAIAALGAKSEAVKAAKNDTIEDFRKSVQLSAVPWINDWLLKFELAPRLRILLYQADLKWSTGTLLFICAISFAVSAFLVYWRTDSIMIALLVGLAMAFAPLGFVSFKRDRRFRAFEQELPESLDLMVSALRAGHSLNAALGLVSRECQEPVRSEFKICFDEQNYGLELRAAMDNMTVRVPLQDLRIATTAILIQKETGGNLAEVLNKCSEVIRERFRLRRQVRVHTAHGRFTGYVIGLLPVILMFGLYLVSPETESVLWKTHAGQMLLYGAATSMILGGLIIRKIVNMEV